MSVRSVCTRICRRVIDPVMHIERQGIWFSHPGTVNIRLIGQDQRGGDGMDWIAHTALVFMGANGAHDDGGILRRGFHPGQDAVRQERAGLRVSVTPDDVAYVVEVPRNGRKFLFATAEPRTPENHPRVPRNDFRVAKAVVGVSDHAKILVCRPDQLMHFRISPDLGQGDRSQVWHARIRKRSWCWRRR